MEKKKFLVHVFGQFINVVWSLIWALLSAVILYFLVPKFFDLTPEILNDLCCAFAIVVFVAVWLLNYPDTHKFINRF